MIKKVLGILLLGGVGYGVYKMYRKGVNKVIDFSRLQITLGRVKVPKVEKGFLSIPLDLSINNPTDSAIDGSVVPLTAFAELSLETRAGTQPLFSGLVNLAGSSIKPKSITTVPLTLQGSLLQL